VIGIADAFNVHEPDVVLHVRQTRIRRFRLTREIGLERCHARVDEHEGRIVLGNDPRRLDELMIAIEEVVQKHLTHLFGGFVR